MTEHSGADPHSPVAISQRTVGGTLVVQVTGEIDLDTAPDLDAALGTALCEAGDGGCIADLTDVTFLGSRGLSTLISATQVADERREPLKIVVDANRTVIRPIETTGLEQELHLYHSVDEALQAGR